MTAVVLVAVCLWPANLLIQVLVDEHRSCRARRLRACESPAPSGFERGGPAGRPHGWRDLIAPTAAVGIMVGWGALAVGVAL